MSAEVRRGSGRVEGAVSASGNADPTWTPDPAKISPNWRPFVHLFYDMPPGWEPPGGWPS